MRTAGGPPPYASAKAEGWTRYQFRVEFTDGEAAVMPGKDNPYMQAFLGGLICRPSCHQCPFKGPVPPQRHHAGRLLGVKQICPEALERQGTTLALVHTEKGAAALEALRERAAVTEVDPVAAVTYNRAALRPSPAAPRRKMFWRAYRGNGLEEIARRCLEPTLSQRVKTAAGGTHCSGRGQVLALAEERVDIERFCAVFAPICVKHKTFLATIFRGC